MIEKKSFFVLVLLLLMLLNCAPNEIKIGVALPRSGEQAPMAQTILQGVQLAVEEWNIRGGALGKKIVLEIMDDEANAEKAVSVAHELVKRKVIGVIGHMNSHCSIAASKIYNDAGIVMISPSSTNPVLTEQNLKTIFRVCGRDDAQAKTAADFICDILKVKTIYFINDRSVYGQGLVRGVKELLGKKIEIKGESYVNQGDTTFNDLIEEIKKLGPDLIYFGGYDPEGARIVSQLAAAGIRTKFMGGDGLASENYLKLAGKNAEGTFLTFGLSVEDLGSAMHFVRRYKEKYKKVDYYAPYAYDATNILLDAYCQAKEGSIAEVLRRNQFDGALGLTVFDARGDVMKAPYMVWTVRDGSFKPWAKEL